MELFSAADVMKSPVKYVYVKESVKTLSNLLLDTNHGAFPVVQFGNGFEKTFLGIITRYVRLG
jgi:CBS domain-containing protein